MKSLPSRLSFPLPYRERAEHYDHETGQTTWTTQSWDRPGVLSALASGAWFDLLRFSRYDFESEAIARYARQATLFYNELYGAFDAAA